MKKIALLLLAFFPLRSFCQEVSELAKYSYYIYGKSSHPQIINGSANYLTVDATCFFVRKGGLLYICGAAHTFTGAVHRGEMPLLPYFPDILFVKVYNDETKSLDEIAIDITTIKNSIPADFFDKHSDVWAMPVNMPQKYRIYSIEKFICDNIKIEVYTKALLYAFPKISNKKKQLCEFDMTTLTRARNVESNLSDVFTLSVKTGISGHGESGAPLFFITGKNICFAGLYNGIDYAKNSIFSYSFYLTKLLK